MYLNSQWIEHQEGLEENGEKGKNKRPKTFHKKRNGKKGVGWSVRYIIEIIFYSIHNDKKRLDSRQ